MTTTFHRHWRDVPESTWRWPNFSPAEIACRGTGKLLINEPALDKLQALRDRLGKPLIVRSAYRSPEHNRAVGGATRSKHMDGAAFDIAMANHDPVAFEAVRRGDQQARRSAGATVCPPVVEYSREFQARAADELDLLPDGSAIAEMLADYGVTRDQAPACSER